jgi:hypothetical protein
VKTELQAQRMLEAARQQLATGNAAAQDRAKSRLTAISRNFSETEAADEARKLLGETAP